MNYLKNYPSKAVLRIAILIGLFAFVTLFLFRPSLAEFSLNSAVTNYQDKSYLPAEWWSRIATWLTPDSARAHRWHGIILERQGSDSQAIQELNKALSLGLDDPEIRIVLGSALFKTGYYLKSQENFSRATEMDPTSGWAYYWLAKSLQKLNRISEAIKYGVKSTELEPDNGVFKASLILIYKDAGEYEKALLAADESISLDPSNCAPYNRKATVLAVLGNFDQAFSAISQAFDLASSRKGDRKNGCLALTHLTRAGIYEIKQEIPLAVSDYKTVLSIPASGEVYQGVTEMHRNAQTRLNDLGY